MINDQMPFAGLSVGQVKTLLKLLLSSNRKPTQIQPEMVGIEEVMKITGYTKSTIYKLIHERKIPFTKAAHGGRKVFFRTVEIHRWLRTSRFETNDEFVRNHRRGKTRRVDSKSELRQRLNSMRLLHCLLATFMNMIYEKGAKISALEKKVAGYEANEQIIENLFVETKTNQNE